MISVDKYEGKRPLESCRRRWEYIIKMDVKEIRCGGVDWIAMAQGRDLWRAVMNTVMDFRFHKQQEFS
jgi:hypothetical protein